MFVDSGPQIAEWPSLELVGHGDSIPSLVVLAQQENLCSRIGRIEGGGGVTASCNRSTQGMMRYAYVLETWKGRDVPSL